MEMADDGGPGVDRLCALVGSRPTGEATAVGEPGEGGARGGGSYGGRLVSQALAACAHTVGAGSVPESMHAYLLAGGDVAEPIDFTVERLRDGRAFQHRSVRGYQGDRLLVYATVASVVPQAGGDWQRDPPHVVPAPGTTTSWAGRLLGDVFEAAMPKGRAIADTGELVHPLWVRSLVELPEDPWLHAAAVAYLSDLGLNGVVRHVHADQLGSTVHSLSTSHALWFHRTSLLDRWHVLDVDPVSVAGTQGFVEASLRDETGRLVASIGQGVFIRRPVP
jgi:acyl-CoA thioesterase II